MWRLLWRSMLSARVRERCDGPGEGLCRREIVAGVFSARFLHIIKLAVPEQLLEARLWACVASPLVELIEDCLRRTFGVAGQCERSCMWVRKLTIILKVSVLPAPLSPVRRMHWSSL